MSPAPPFIFVVAAVDTSSFCGFLGSAIKVTSLLAFISSFCSYFSLDCFSHSPSPRSCFFGLLGFKGGIVAVGFSDDVFEETGIRSGGFGRRSMNHFLQRLQITHLGH